MRLIYTANLTPSANNGKSHDVRHEITRCYECQRSSLQRKIPPLLQLDLKGLLLTISLQYGLALALKQRQVLAGLQQVVLSSFRSPGLARVSFDNRLVKALLTAWLAAHAQAAVKQKLN